MPHLIPPDWHPPPRWADALRPALAALPHALHAPEAWRAVAILPGDTGAPSLCLLVSLYAHDTAPSADDRRRIGGHLALCLLDLGLGHPAPEGRSGIRPDQPALDALLDALLAPLGGDLERGALLALGLAAHRTGLLTLSDPDDPQILSDPGAWGLPLA